MMMKDVEVIIDQAQRKQALDGHKSFIVQAPAGSGKTELLIQRYLVLLAKVEKVPEQVVAITFTRKAALEMRHRVMQAIQYAKEHAMPLEVHKQQTWLLAKEVLMRDEKENWQLLQQPNRLNMMTIDSFCSSLTKQMPLTSGFGGTPEILEDATYYYQKAAEFVCLNLSKEEKWKTSIRNLLWHFDNQLPRLQLLIAELLGKREQWLDYIHLTQNKNLIEERLVIHLKNLIEDTLNSALQIFPTNLKAALCDLLSFASSQCKQNGVDNPYLLNYINVNLFPSHHADQLSTWKCICHFLLTSKGDVRKKVDTHLGFLPKSQAKTSAEKQFLEARKKDMERFLEEIDKQKELIPFLKLIQNLPDAEYSTQQQQILMDLLEVLALSAAQLTVLFQQEGVCDFNQIMLGALQSLGTRDEATDLALSLDYRIQHILVDEFQDNSSIQFRLLERLIMGWQEGDGRTLFLVGDPMQSIYRFRQAEVGLFLTAWQQGIGQISLNPLVLQTNFRSTHTIVNWINHHMQWAFPRFIDVGIGAVPFTPATAFKINEIRTQVDFFAATDESIEAQQVLSLVKNALADNTQDSIAILVRARSHLKNLLPLMQQSNIPYQAIEIESLHERAVLQDLLALTRALLHPADKVAWLALLRAPFCRLTLIELTELVELNPNACIIENLLAIKDWSFCSPETQEMLKHFTAVMYKALMERHRLSCSEWILGVWLALNAASYYDENTLNQDVQKYLNLLEKIGTEIYYLLPDELEQYMQKLFATPLSHARVQIMTMHKAKGLEFDTVIIPQLHRGNAQSDRPLLTWWERTRQKGVTELLLAVLNAVGEPEPLYQYISQQNKQAEKLEATRLLYVAMTRAKKYLHLTAVVDETPPTNCLLNSIWPSLKPQESQPDFEKDLMSSN